MRSSPNLRKLTLLDSAQRLEDLAAVSGNRLEALAGDRKGQHSIRVNQQYRITFRWERHDAHDVWCMPPVRDRPFTRERSCSRSS